MWERSLVQVDLENTYCLHSLSLTAVYLKCVAKLHSQVKMQTWNHPTWTFIWRMVFVSNSVSLFKQTINFWCQINKFRSGGGVTSDFPSDTIVLSKYPQLHPGSFLSIPILNVVSWRTLLITSLSLQSSAFTGRLKSTFATAHSSKELIKDFSSHVTEQSFKQCYASYWFLWCGWWANI